MKKFLPMGIFSLVVSGLPLLAWADVAEDVQQQCGVCHAMTHDYAKQDVVERIKRKAPPLDYAGNKFNQEWLVGWLQNPTHIRPAGEFPSDHVKTGSDGQDVIDASTLPKHPLVAGDQAKVMADYLMTLKPFDDLVAKSKYKPGKIAKKMGQMNFVKFKGCAACHQYAKNKGGVSGPELYTGWQRLQPEFIASYISDSMAWDPHTMMPKGDLNDANVAKLANYLKVIGESK